MLLLVLSLLTAVDIPTSSPDVKVVSKTTEQEGGSWRIRYKFKFSKAASVDPKSIKVRIESWVSNSRTRGDKDDHGHDVPNHSAPKKTVLKLEGVGVDFYEIFPNVCSERLTLRASVEGMEDIVAKTPKNFGHLGIRDDGILVLDLKLEHRHIVHGDYDPLLGIRNVQIEVGKTNFNDVVDLSREQYLAMPVFALSAIPDDRLDDTHFISKPDSLYLAAHHPGDQYFRFSEMPVRYSTRMKLSYWYYIGRGTEGDFLSKVSQYQDTPTTWKILSCNLEEKHTVVGKWVRFERFFTTSPDATTLAIDFRITSETDVGEVWIDDVKLEAVEKGRNENP